MNMMKKRLLLLFYRYPEKRGGMNSFGQHLFYKVLSEHFEVKALTFSNHPHTDHSIKEIPIQDRKNKKLLNMIFRLRSPRLTHYFSEQFYHEYRTTIDEFNPDYIYVEHTVMMQYPLKYRNSAQIFFFNDESSIYIHDKGIRKNLIEKIRNIRLNKYEKKACEISDKILTITDDEANHLESIGFHNVIPIPYGIDCEYFIPKLKFNANRLRILFVGDFSHYPNREAAEIISKNIYPAFKTNEKVEFIIAGRQCNKIRAKLDPSISLFSDVEDIRECYNNADLFLAPIYSGGGLRIKILEAAASGLPILMTPLANLGIHLLHNKEALISNSIQEMMSYIQSISNNEITIDLKILGTNARKNIEDNFDKKIIAKRIERCANTIL